MTMNTTLIRSAFVKRSFKFISSNSTIVHQRKINGKLKLNWVMCIMFCYQIWWFCLNVLLALVWSLYRDSKIKILVHIYCWDINGVQSLQPEANDSVERAGTYMATNYPVTFNRQCQLVGCQIWDILSKIISAFSELWGLYSNHWTLMIEKWDMR